MMTAGLRLQGGIDLGHAQFPGWMGLRMAPETVRGFPIRYLVRQLMGWNSTLGLNSIGELPPLP